MVGEGRRCLEQAASDWRPDRGSGEHCLLCATSWKLKNEVFTLTLLCLTHDTIHCSNQSNVHCEDITNIVILNVLSMSGDLSRIP